MRRAIVFTVFRVRYYIIHLNHLPENLSFITPSANLAITNKINCFICFLSKLANHFFTSSGTFIFTPLEMARRDH